MCFGDLAGEGAEVVEHTTRGAHLDDQHVRISRLGELERAA
jgi:hypothetical protein